MLACRWLLCHRHGDGKSFAAVLEGEVGALMDGSGGQSLAPVTLTLGVLWCHILQLTFMP